LKYGIPEDGRMVRYYTNHALVYNQQMRIPVWVAEHLTKENLQGNLVSDLFLNSVLFTEYFL
jgi:DNA/RNA endonuclease G (NUC1)